jgi:DNA-directed RNA polymerase subunit RPC12/RpoP
MSKVIGMDGSAQRPNKGLNINVKASDLKDIVCDNCGCKFFRHVHSFKRLSALISPSGKEQIVPIPIYRCDECGHINDEFLPKDA